ncbi:GNAT family N-acetyltransferase [Loktanella sp. Alg231-35]|uniref:GNAT family N-acetyltransferase n=1 Tax=Loktanella sp. Alg231-35 TaxID=1922220 RepID=UPI000D55620E|nr:GNAT family N-acetyltransferase [Loktanella sp. Alg231-35]
MSNPAVQHFKDGSKGRYFLAHPSGESALTYSIMSSKQVIADHTEVAEGHEGEGIGLILLREFIADARREGFKIVPLCPYVNAQCRKHPEWADAFSV